MRRKSMSEAKRLRLEVPPTLPCPASASSNFAGFFCGISIALGETHEKERRINAINLLTSGEIRPGDQSLRDQNRSVESGTLAITQPYLGKNLRAKSCWAITYPESLLAFLVLATLAWTQFDFSGRGIPDWKPVLALGDAAQEKGDLYYAKSLYLQGGEARGLARRLGRLTRRRLRHQEAGKRKRS